jgi:hypothetical protein
MRCIGAKTNSPRAVVRQMSLLALLVDPADEIVCCPSEVDEFITRTTRADFVNVYVDLAERQIRAPRKARMRAAEKRAAKTDDRENLARLYACWRRERVETLIAGHGEAVLRLLAFLDSMTIDHAAELIAVIEQGPWRSVDADTRFQVLVLVDAAIVRLREKYGLTPFDDPLVGEPPNAFQIIKGLLL